MGWVGSGWIYVMGWIGLNFFLPTMVGWVKKSPQPDPCTPLIVGKKKLFFNFYFFKKEEIVLALDN